MPIYEYQCSRCGALFEVIQKFSDAPIETHAECGGSVARLISAPALQFKGTGWYITDYAKSGGLKSDTAGGKSADGKGSETKTESKAETKPESKPSTTTKTD